MLLAIKQIALAAIVATGFLCNAATAQTSFYQASDAEIAGAPGTVIREEPMFGAAAGASAHRVLYRSTSPEGRPSTFA